jgi:hypothetical protein
MTESVVPKGVEFMTASEDKRTERWYRLQDEIDAEMSRDEENRPQACGPQ